MNPMKKSSPFSITAPYDANGTAARFFIMLLASLILTAHAHAASKLDTAIIQGSSVYSPAELFDVYKIHLGGNVTDQTAKAIAEALQQKYIADGFSRPGYRVADRGTDSGIVRIELVEASVSRVEMKGDTGPYRQELEDLVGDLSSGRSLRPEEIREVLRRARRLPGLDVQVTAENDPEQSGGFVLEFDSAYKPVEGSVKLSNRGTEEIGRNLFSARLVTNGLFGRENASGLFFTTAEDSDNYSGGGFFADTALGSRGTSAQLQAAATSLQFETQGIHVEQSRDRASLKVRHLLQRQSAHDFSFWAGFGTEDLDVEYNGLVAREERLRSFELGLSLAVRGSTSQYFASAEVEQGMNGFGSRLDNFANPDDSSDNVFTITRLHYIHLSRLNDAWTVRWDSVAQHSAHVLPSIKRFKVGGGRIGRGFEAAAIRGDLGIGNKLELKRRVANDVPWLGRADVYGFYDLGSAWRNDLGGRESASSAGVGASMRGNWLSGYIEVAKPLTHADADGRKDMGIFAELTARF